MEAPKNVFDRIGDAMKKLPDSVKSGAEETGKVITGNKDSHKGDEDYHNDPERQDMYHTGDDK